MYPEPILYPEKIMYPKEAKCKIIRGINFGTLTYIFIKKTIFNQKFIPCLYLKTKKELYLQIKESNCKYGTKEKL